MIIVAAITHWARSNRSRIAVDIYRGNVDHERKERRNLLIKSLNNAYHHLTTTGKNVDPIFLNNTWRWDYIGFKVALLIIVITPTSVNNKKVTFRRSIISIKVWGTLPI